MSDDELAAQLAYDRSRLPQAPSLFSVHTRNRLPSFFVDDDRKHSVRIDPMTAEKAQKYREMLREISTRPIKKVAEAKARRYRKVRKQMMRAEAISSKALDSTVLTEAERNKELKRAEKMMRRFAHPGRQTLIGGAASAGRRGSKQPLSFKASRGRMKTVDRRMKKDRHRYGHSFRAQRLKKKEDGAG